MSQKDTKITVLGDGGWGTALSLALAAEGRAVTLWGAFPDYVEKIRRKRENVKFLPGFKIPENISLSADIRESCAVSEVLVLATPSQYLRGVLKKIKGSLGRKIVVSVAKGIETQKNLVMSEVIRQELGERVRLAILSGPSIAREVALKMPAALCAASKDRNLRARVREIFTTSTLSVFESDDMLGVELGGSLKNVIAIGIGIVQGLGLGSNTQAALFARGVAEMARLGSAMGARRQTFMGLSGVGDLATTVLSPHSRNRWLGEEIGKGKTLRKILKATEMVVEGVDTSKSAAALSKKHGVSMPITRAVHDILFASRNPRLIVRALTEKGLQRELD